MDPVRSFVLLLEVGARNVGSRVCKCISLWSATQIQDRGLTMTLSANSSGIHHEGTAEIVMGMAGITTGDDTGSASVLRSCQCVVHEVGDGTRAAGHSVAVPVIADRVAVTSADGVSAGVVESSCSFVIKA